MNVTTQRAMLQLRERMAVGCKCITGPSRRHRKICPLYKPKRYKTYRPRPAFGPPERLARLARRRELYRTKQTQHERFREFATILASKSA